MNFFIEAKLFVYYNEVGLAPYQTPSPSPQQLKINNLQDLLSDHLLSDRAKD